MKKGSLSDYVTGVAAKRLSRVETDTKTSNQHEFDGVADFKKILGTEKRKFPATFIYFEEDEEKTISSEGFLTWYDARENHPYRSEYRLYFPSTPVSEVAEPGDMVFIARKPDNSVLVIITQEKGTVENQLLWLFGIQDRKDLTSGFSVKEIEEKNNKKLDLVSGIILEHLGIVVEDEDESYLDLLLKTFPNGFPQTSAFSEFARGTLKDVSSIENPDRALIAWMEHEEILFKTFERHIVSKRLERNFNDVDDFISFSLSVQNRRKSRAGYAFEHHLEQIFRDHKINYSRNKVTENNSKPDFVFPGIKEYHNEKFPSSRLAMLGVKTTCKDRWRQILAEAQRISKKHLATLEPGISTNQTDEMISQNLQLVIPQNIHPTYTSSQQKRLMTIKDFISFVGTRPI